MKLMSNEVAVLTKKDLETNPAVIGESIAQLALSIEDTKSGLSSIQDRGFWKRLTSNNTRDLAEAMIQQNDTISAFLTIIQGVIFLSMNNLVVLGGIMDSIKNQEKTNGVRDNKYIGMAKDYLSEAIKSAQKVSSNEKEIERVKNELTVYYKNQTNQEKLLGDLRTELKNSKLSELQQDKIISTLENRLNKQDNMDKQQDIIISQLQKEMRDQDIEDKRQAEIIDFVKGEIATQDAEDKRQAALIKAITDELENKKRVDEEQNQRLEQLQKTAEVANKLIEQQDIEDKRQAELIQRLQKTLDKNKELIDLQDKEDKRQAELIDYLGVTLKKNEELITQQDEEDKRQAAVIDKIMQELLELKEENARLKASIDGAGQAFDSKLKAAYAVGGGALLISIIAVVLSLI
jgi:hypothetical protein